MNAWQPLARGRPVFVYVLVVVIGVAAFIYPFWLPDATFGAEAHRGDAPLLAAGVAVLVLGAIALEARRGTMSGATIGMLAVLSAAAALLRLLDLPGGGNAMFFLIVLAGAAFGPRFGLLLGLASMAVSAVLTGGIGPWLPFQMLVLSWMSAGAGFVGIVTVRMSRWAEVVVLAVYGWIWGFIYGAVMNLWFWPFVIDDGPLAWSPGLSLSETLQHYWSFYVATSFAWDAAGAVANAVLILVVGIPLLRSLRRFAPRLDPIAEFELFSPQTADAG